MNLFQRAAANLNLSPCERALLKTLQSFIITVLIAGLLEAASYINSTGPISWQHLVYVMLIAIIFSLAHGIAKFFMAQGDTPLGAAIEAVTEAAEKKLPPTGAQKPPG